MARRNRRFPRTWMSGRYLLAMQRFRFVRSSARLRSSIPVPVAYPNRSRISISPLRQRAGPRDCGTAHFEFSLDPEELRQLDEVSALPREYPGWVLPFQETNRLEQVDPWE